MLFSNTKGRLKTQTADFQTAFRILTSKQAYGTINACVAVRHIHLDGRDCVFVRTRISRQLAVLPSPADTERMVCRTAMQTGRLKTVKQGFSDGLCR
ncbi:hypothetical protein [Kingella potus]|uniref:hypothetical protein n=1 Tax=Kingella potus TaxID=265175 RepID=UPI001FD00543|nr:hypothetical protein [Kingella potus]UOP01680.1 hypothetical protein LVJ84_05955 [Kingella potus]